MKKKILLALTLIVTMSFTFLLSGCSDAYDYDLSKFVELGEYEGLPYDPSGLEISDETVQNTIDELLEESYDEDKTSAIKDKDVVNIDYKGTVDGKEFDGNSASGYDLTIGSKTFIDDFEEQLIGHMAGDKVKVEVTFPKDYENDKDLQGKDAVFEVTVNYIKVKAEYNDEWVKAHTSYETCEEYTKATRERLENQAKVAAGATILTLAVSNAEIKNHPDKEVTDLVEQAVSYYKEYAENNGMEYADFLSNYMGTDEETLNAQLKEQAKAQVAQEMVAYQIARICGEDLEAGSDAVDKYMQMIMDANGLTEETFEETAGMSFDEYKEKYEHDIIIATTIQNVEKYLVDKGVADADKAKEAAANAETDNGEE
ncbi:MAG: FKBP-type peptidyl-prolyl cis-trans isomerase [Clostridia bacterium]|nr:FKBP-type peptidyl-prolyl cis-trans isomerase [Clostridia bacterium]